LTLAYSFSAKAPRVIPSAIIGFSINPTHPHYATIRENGMLEITDYHTSALVGSYLIPLPFQDINDLDPTGFHVGDISYSPDGELIAVSINDISTSGMIYLVDWRANSIQPVDDQVNLHRIVDMSWNIDGNRLVVASIDGGADQLIISDVAIVNIDSEQIEQILANMARVDNQAWTVVAWSPLDIIAYANNTTLVFWDTNADAVLMSTTTSVDTHDAVWSPGGHHLATLSSDRTLQIWEVNSDLSAPVRVMSLNAENFLSNDMQWIDDTLLAVNVWTDIQIWNTSTAVLEKSIETDHFIMGMGTLNTNEFAFAGPELINIFPLTDIRDIAPPTPAAGADQTLSADASGNALVTLDGSASMDPDGTIVSYVWSINGEEIAGQDTATPTATTSAPGFGPGFQYDLTYRLVVTDDDGATSSAEFRLCSPSCSSGPQ